MKIINTLDNFSPFPDPETALTEPNGLLAVGGDLSFQRLVMAYQQGIFPWYSFGEPIMWWSPNPRLVLFPDSLKISRSLRKVINRKEFKITYDQQFNNVIDACSLPRDGQQGTWITPEMKAAYYDLHRRGYAHSVEATQDGELVGGLYGVSLGRVFFGESMFSFVSNASKAAFANLVTDLKSWEYHLIDCQVHTNHLVSLGAEEIERSCFLNLLRQFCPEHPAQQAWSATFG